MTALQTHIHHVCLIFLLPPFPLCIFLPGWMSLILRWLTTKADFLLTDVHPSTLTVCEASPPHRTNRPPHLHMSLTLNYLSILCFSYRSLREVPQRFLRCLQPSVRKKRQKKMLLQSLLYAHKPDHWRHFTREL